MNMIRIGIVEDDKEDETKLTNIIEDYFKKAQCEFVMESFSNADDILESKNYFDLLFLDIYLNGSPRGMEIAKKMREKYGDDFIIIFITSSMSFAIEGYSVEASAYILKPLTKEDFSLKMMRILPLLKTSDSDFVLLNTTDGIFNVKIMDILYVEVKGHYLSYYVKDKVYTVRQTMNECEKKLVPHSFFRINNYTLINLHSITSIIGGEIQINDKSFTISRNKKQEFKKVLLNDYL